MISSLNLIFLLVLISQSKSSPVSLPKSSVHFSAISATPRPTCVYNATHCSCRNIDNPGTCLQPTDTSATSKVCTARKCCDTGYTCDCTATEMCQFTSCHEWIAADGTYTSDIEMGSQVPCVQVHKPRCLKRIGEEDVENVTIPEIKEYRMVQVGEASENTMFNVSYFKDPQGIISAERSMHGRWPDRHLLKRRVITLRVYDKPEWGEEKMLCAIYNTYGAGSDSLGPMSVSLNITAMNGGTVGWVACDDDGECRGNAIRKNSLTAHHYLNSAVTDGWCVRGLGFDGKRVALKFTGVVGFRSLVVQSPGGVEKEFEFGQDNWTGSVNQDGIVSNGESPDILFNLAGSEVPF